MLSRRLCGAGEDATHACACEQVEKRAGFSAQLHISFRLRDR